MMMNEKKRFISVMKKYFFTRPKNQKMELRVILHDHFSKQSSNLFRHLSEYRPNLFNPTIKYYFVHLVSSSAAVFTSLSEKNHVPDNGPGGGSTKNHLIELMPNILELVQFRFAY